jgi:hypothetical protein
MDQPNDQRPPTFTDMVAAWAIPAVLFGLLVLF